MTIRRATYGDRHALIRLAQRDSARVPDGPLVIGEVGGVVRAAVAVAGGAAIADPFHRTAELVALLRERAEQIRDARLGDGRRRPMRLVARTPLTDAGGRDRIAA